MSNANFSIWDAKNNLAYNDSLAADDNLFVDIARARGDFSLQRFYRNLNIDNEGKLQAPSKKQYTLFTGHRGCGKSTELARIAKYLHDPERYFVVHLDCLKTLDTNNLQYSDVLLALATKLLIKLENEHSIHIAQVHLTNLEDWFKERIESHVNTKELGTEIQAGMKAKTGLPFLATIFAKLTNSVSIGSSYREELRKVVRNNFSEFAEIFNKLLRAVESSLQENSNFAQYILFTVDGTDRLDHDDNNHFFIDSVHQLTLIESRFIYCAPIHLLHAGNPLNANFGQIFRLPMLKIRDQENQKITDHYAIVRELVYKRVPLALFDNEETINYLICYSGGHPRDLLRLLNTAITYTETEVIDINAAKQAVKQVAFEYRRLMTTEEYQLLVKIDQDPENPDDYTSEVSSKLLYNLILLEYNNYFWKSHPIITTLSGYQKALEQYNAQNDH